ncbi:MAG: GTP-binding protein [Rhodocyclaceae bacterium]|nr:MAG: GTP-binding protein [Rhodocyclaceae bacterium]
MTQAPSAAPIDHRIPVTLLTGFLGAGKTTMLNHLVSHPDMAGTALLINEFGEVGIDHHLVDQVDETLLVLDSGCICCSVQGDLVKALKNLAQRSSRREIPPVLRVVIETTGLADPVPVVYTLMQERFVAARYRCDGVITAVDATHALQQLDVHREAVRQVVMADRLLMTKCDLAGADVRAALERQLDVLNPGAPHIEVHNGRVAPDAVFGCGIYTSSGKSADVATWLGEEQARAQPTLVTPGQMAWTRKGAAPRTVPPPARHDGLVNSFVVKFDAPVTWLAFAIAMGRILEAHGPQLLRIKGLMNVAGDPKPRVIHCVQDVAYPPVNLAQWPEQSIFGDHQGRLVFIVRELAPEAVAGIQAALSSAGLQGATVRDTFCPAPTRCWLEHNVAANSEVELEGWVVQKKRFGKRA